MTGRLRQPPHETVDVALVMTKVELSLRQAERRLSELTWSTAISTLERRQRQLALSIELMATHSARDTGPQAEVAAGLCDLARQTSIAADLIVSLARLAQGDVARARSTTAKLQSVLHRLVEPNRTIPPDLGRVSAGQDI